jgi:hypothetical protein
LPCESSLADCVQPGLELREHPFVRRPDIPVLPRRLCLILRRTPVDSLPGALMDLCEITYRNEIVGGSVEHAQELGARIVEAPKFEQGPTECDPRRQIRGVLSQTGLAHPNGLFAVTGPPVFLRELRKRNRRRILQDPASKILNPRVIRHA